MRFVSRSQWPFERSNTTSESGTFEEHSYPMNSTLKKTAVELKNALALRASSATHPTATPITRTEDALTFTELHLENVLEEFKRTLNTAGFVIEANDSYQNGSELFLEFLISAGPGARRRLWISGTIHYSLDIAFHYPKKRDEALVIQENERIDLSADRIEARIFEVLVRLASIVLPD